MKDVCSAHALCPDCTVHAKQNRQEKKVFADADVAQTMSPAPEGSDHRASCSKKFGLDTQHIAAQRNCNTERASAEQQLCFYAASEPLGALRR